VAPGANGGARGAHRGARGAHSGACMARGAHGMAGAAHGVAPGAHGGACVTRGAHCGMCVARGAHGGAYRGAHGCVRGISRCARGTRRGRLSRLAQSLGGGSECGTDQIATPRWTAAARHSALAWVIQPSWASQADRATISAGAAGGRSGSQAVAVEQRRRSLWEMQLRTKMRRSMIVLGG